MWTRGPPRTSGAASRPRRRGARRCIEVEGVEQVKERVRDVRIGSALAAAARDARYGARVLWRSPGYALVVILTIALGIGVNAAVFSVVHAVLWRSLPYPDAARIVVVEADTRGAAERLRRHPARCSTCGRESRLITSIAQAEGRDASLDGRRRDGARRRGQGDRRSAAAAGRHPAARANARSRSEDADGITVKGVVISHELWQRRFQGDPRVIGRRLTVNNFDVQIVGVMRPAFVSFCPRRTTPRSASMCCCRGSSRPGRSIGD